MVRIRPGFHDDVGACRETPLRLAKSRLTAVARLHGACGRTSQAQRACQLSFALSSCTPFFKWLHLLNLSGALFLLPFWGWCSAPLLPPLGVVLRAANQDSNDCRWQSYLCFVPRSGKGGVVGDFEPSPFIEQHPLSQPCRFRSAVKSASSPNGEPRWLLRIRPSLYKNIGACRETPQSARSGCQLPHRGGKGTYSPVPMRILARAELASRMTVFSVPVRLFFRAFRARVNS